MARFSTIARRLAVLAATLVAVPATATAQTDFPRRAVKFVVPVPPGNMLDSMPRIIGEKLSTRWNQPVIVENRPGAASNLGTEAVFKSAPRRPYAPGLTAGTAGASTSIQNLDPSSRSPP